MSERRRAPSGCQAGAMATACVDEGSEIVAQLLANDAGCGEKWGAEAEEIARCCAGRDCGAG